MKKKTKPKQKKSKWIYFVFLITFILSLVFGYITNLISLHSSIATTVIIIFSVIAVGILFDMLGASTLTSKEASFHAKSAKKIKGSKEAIGLIKNNVKVSSVCNDIVGDICGIISGGLGAVLALAIADKFIIDSAVVTMLCAAVISALTVGGKAIFKNVAIKNADNIVFGVSKLLSFFKKN